MRDLRMLFPWRTGLSHEAVYVERPIMKEHGSHARSKGRDLGARSAAVPGNPVVIAWLGRSVAAGLLQRIACNMIGPDLAQEREDLVNTALVRALAGSSGVTATSTRALTAWFRRILRNVLFDHLRRRYLGTHEHPCPDVDGILDQSPSPEEIVDAGTIEDLIRHRIDRLPPTQQSVLHLMVREGLSRREVALELNMRPEAVSMAQTRAIRNLRSSMESSCLVFEGSMGLRSENSSVPIRCLDVCA